jgi:hypothetical protein
MIFTVVGQFELRRKAFANFSQRLERSREPWDRQQAARETLTLDPDGAGIALLAARFYFDGTRAGREGVRQTKDHLRKVRADYGPDVFRRKIVSFVITPGQINYDGGRGFALY